MASFSLAIPVILAHEGGWANDPDDPGGPTNYGLSLYRFWLGRDRDDFPQLSVVLSFAPPETADQVKALTKGQAEETYRKCWWDRFQYGRVDDQRVATKIMDMAVNMRRPVAHQLAQRAANDCGASLSVDGIFGELTVGAINTTEANEYLRAVCHEHAERYRAIVRRDPVKAKFLATWLKRASWPFPPSAG